MALDPRIILAGQGADIMGALDQGQQAGARQNAIGQQNALAQLFQQQGAGIAAGDQNALNALAAIDPMASLGVQGQRQNMAATQQRMEMLTREEQRAIQQQAATLSAAERAAEAQRIEQGVAMGLGARNAQEWDMIMSRSAPDLVGQFDQREILANRFMSIADIIKRQDSQNAGPEYRPATPEEAAQYGAAGGQINSRTGQFTAINPPRGLSVKTNPDGTFEFVEGSGVGGGAGAAVKPGTAPQGYSLVPDPNAEGGVRMVPTPGGPAEAEAREAEERAVRRQAQIARAGGTVIQDLQRALELLPELGALTRGEGVVGGLARSGSANVPGSVVNRITQFTESALSNVGLDTLQQMRDNSPTGGALGQVPIQQQKRLEQVLGSLDVTQPPPVLEANIKRVMNIYTDIIYGSAEERAFAMRNGDLTPEGNAQIQSFYYELPFDERGRPVDPSVTGRPNSITPEDEALIQRFLGGN